MNLNERSITMNNTQAFPVTDPHNPEPDFITNARVIEGAEKLDDWLEHREIVVEELCPVGALETLYAQRAALYLRRLDRVIGFENAAKIGEIEVGAGKSLEDSQESLVNRDSPDRATLLTIIKYEAHLVRCLSSTMTELRRLQKERRQGLRDVNPGARGADRAGACLNELDNKGSHGGSPSRQITRTEFLIPGGRGADRAGGCQNQQIKDGSPGGSPSQTGSPVQNGSPTQAGSPSQKSTVAEMLIPGGRGADRAGVCQNQQIKDGSPGGSPSQTGSPVQNGSPSQAGSPSRQITNTEMLIPGGRGADRAGGCQNQQIKDGSPGGSPSQTGSLVQNDSPTQAGSPTLQITNNEM
jgi:hypothetical protein